MKYWVKQVDKVVAFWRAKDLGSTAKVVEESITVDPNRFNHIFNKVEHSLEGLVRKFGSEEKAYSAVQKAANSALKQGKLTPNTNGILPNGNNGNIITVGGMPVRLIGGKVDNGKVIISSFSRKGL